MEFRVEDIISSAVIMNGDTLFVKISAMLHQEVLNKIKADLQSQTNIKIVILPFIVDEMRCHER